MSTILPLFPDDVGGAYETTAGGSFNEPIRDSDAFTLRSFKEYVQRYRISLVGTSRVSIDVKKTFGHLTVVVSPTQMNNLIGRYPFQKNQAVRAKPMLPLRQRTNGNELQVEWSSNMIEICKISPENDGIYTVTIVFE
ncbi:MAG: hypothetical protein EOP45_17585 [Sphingobacteriaceae bacterium]|nr:MAG: hypothetical protein EOP45_17585 [Sphingobacteriaceae bacterium]